VSFSFLMQPVGRRGGPMHVRANQKPMRMVAGGFVRGRPGAPCPRRISIKRMGFTRDIVEDIVGRPIRSTREKDIRGSCISPSTPPPFFPRISPHLFWNYRMCQIWCPIHELISAHSHLIDNSQPLKCFCTAGDRCWSPVAGVGPEPAAGRPVGGVPLIY